MKRTKIKVLLGLLAMVAMGSLSTRVNAAETSHEIINTVEMVGELKQEIEEEKEMQGEALIEISEPELDYNPVPISVEDRSLLEGLVMGESSGEGFEGAALVAQCIRDTMVEDNDFNTLSIKRNHGYYAGTGKEPSDDVKRAVAFIFDDGGYVVRHKIKYFYAPNVCSSPFHESQDFVIEYGGHRFFGEQ